MTVKKKRKKTLITQMSYELHEMIKILAVKNNTTIAKYVEGKLRGIGILKYASNGNLDKLKESIKNPEDIWVKDYDNGTLAHYAAYGGHLHILTFIKENNGTLDELDADGNRPINFASANGHTECVEFFRNEGITEWS